MFNGQEGSVCVACMLRKSGNPMDFLNFFSSLSSLHNKASGTGEASNAQHFMPQDTKWWLIDSPHEVRSPPLGGIDFSGGLYQGSGEMTKEQIQSYLQLIAPQCNSVDGMCVNASSLALREDTACSLAHAMEEPANRRVFMTVDGGTAALKRMLELDLQINAGGGGHCKISGAASEIQRCGLAVLLQLMQIDDSADGGLTFSEKYQLRAEFQGAVEQLSARSSNHESKRLADVLIRLIK